MSIEKRKAKFKLLIERRVNKFNHLCKLIENMSNKSNYTYSSEEMQQVIEALELRFKTCKKTLTKAMEEESEIVFKLREVK